MDQPLRLLLIEDDTGDALLIVHELERSGYAVTWEQVQTAPGLESALQRPWDVITCDWVMPAFSAPDALKLLGEHDIDLPVIIVSGQAAEEVTVTAMKAGAHDVVSKQKLTRLGPAVDRELRETAGRRAHKRADAALRASEIRYRRLFETARDGIFILDARSGQITDVNPFLLELLGHSREEILGKELWEISPFNDTAANQNAFRDLQTKEYIRYDDLPLETKDGRHVDVEFVSNAYQANGDRVIQCNVRDISERKQSERMIRTLNEELAQQVRERTAQLNALTTELEAFSFSVSHDLRTPLRHVEGFCNLLLESHAGQLDNQGRRYLDLILEGTKRMGQLIADLLNLSSVTQAEMVPDAVNISDLAQSIVADLHTSEPGRQVESVITPGVVVKGDARLLRVALENVLRNAWKYTSKHPTARIELGTTERDGRPVCFVRDDGAGFDMAYAGKLFGAFQRLHTESEFEGSGIGLATVQRIIHRHGGQVWAEAAVERGATIYFTLAPAARAATGARTERAQPRT